MRQMLEDIRMAYASNPRVVIAAVKLQLALLDATRQSVKRNLPNAKLIDGLTHEEITQLGNGRDTKIPVIRAVRNRTSLGLVEAKKMVENYMKKHLGYSYFPSPGTAFQPY